MIGFAANRLMVGFVKLTIDARGVRLEQPGIVGQMCLRMGWDCPAFVDG
jgi:hypothetical protein